MDYVVGFKNKMKKLTCLLLVIIWIFAFSGCNVIQSVIDFAEEREVDIDTANAQGELIVECFENRDEETLKSMFSQWIASKVNLEEQIKEAFKLFHGNVVEYTIGNGGISRTWDDGVATEKDVLLFVDITTDTGEKYDMSIKLYLSCDSDPSKIGISFINLHLLKYENGVYKYDVYDDNTYRNIG